MIYWLSQSLCNSHIHRSGRKWDASLCCSQCETWIKAVIYIWSPVLCAGTYCKTEIQITIVTVSPQFLKVLPHPCSCTKCGMGSSAVLWWWEIPNWHLPLPSLGEKTLWARQSGHKLSKDHDVRQHITFISKLPGWAGTHKLQGCISISCRSFIDLHFSWCTIDYAHKKLDVPVFWKLLRILQPCHIISFFLCSTLEVTLLLQFLYFSYKSRIYHINFYLSCNIAIWELILYKGMPSYFLGGEIWDSLKKHEIKEKYFFKWKKAWFLASFSV